MTARRKRKLITVLRSDFKMERMADNSPDLSYLGEYSDTRESDASIDRMERGDCLRGEFRYFNPGRTTDAEEVKADYQRMEAYERGEWAMIGIRAAVTLLIPSGDAFISQTLHSPGLWGIESDLDEKYLAEVFEEECETLARMVKALGNVRLIEGGAK